jgi:hypothetical protein
VTGEPRLFQPQIAKAFPHRAFRIFTNTPSFVSPTITDIHSAAAGATTFAPFTSEIDFRQGRNPTFDKHAVLTQSGLRSNLPTSSFSLSVPKARGGPAHFNKRNVEDRNRSELALLGIATPGNSGALAGAEPQQRARGV